VEIQGSVERRTVAAGSKSARAAVVLVTTERTFVLRIAGGHPFADPRLDALVGMTIRAVGDLTGDTFLLRTWDVD
jgi:hypothetical protein